MAWCGDEDQSAVANLNLRTPMSHVNAGERVADRLVTAIALGEFAVGQRLPAERDLAARLGVSRGVVRDALQQLATNGYVSIRRGRSGGAVVVAKCRAESRAIIRRTLVPERPRLEQLLDLGALVEGMIARTAAERRDDSDCVEIRRAVEEYAAAGDDRHRSGEADRHLHLAIHRAAHNPLLASLSYQIRAEISLEFGIEPYSPRAHQIALHQHPQLAAAVMDGDAEQAGHFASEHFGLSEKLVRALIDEVAAESAGGRAATLTPTSST